MFAPSVVGMYVSYGSNPFHVWFDRVHRISIALLRDLDLWPMTLKTFSRHVLHIYAKFHWHPSTIQK